MTICFSIKKPSFIVTGSDTLAENTITHNSLIYKKFIVSLKRNLVVLISGSFLIHPPNVLPRDLIASEMDKVMERNDTLLDVSKKLIQLVHKNYRQDDKVLLELQVCGFDGKTPRIIGASNKIGDIMDVGNYCLTGSPSILGYGATNEGNRSIVAMKQMVSDPEVIQDYVRKFGGHAVDYENKLAKEKGEKPKTGGGINIVTVYSDKLDWHQPRYDSSDDQYKIPEFRFN